MFISCITARMLCHFSTQQCFLLGGTADLSRAYLAQYLSLFPLHAQLRISQISLARASSLSTAFSFVSTSQYFNIPCIRQTLLLNSITREIFLLPQCTLFSTRVYTHRAFAFFLCTCSLPRRAYKKYTKKSSTH